MQQDILIIGKPNCGKTLLFNRLTGLEQKVANFPGVTVEIKSGKFGELSLVDFPGVYSLNAVSRDEEVAVTKLHDALHRNSILAVVCNLDATRLERSLIFGLQAQALAFEHKKPIIFALNMYDEVLKRGEKIDIQAFSKALGSPVIAISAKTLFGMEELKSCLSQMAAQPQKFLPEVAHKTETEHFAKAKSLAQNFSLSPAIFLKQQNKLDKLFLNNYVGGVIFLVVMAILFQAIFSWAAPLMDLTELVIVTTGEWVTSFLSDGVFKDFLNDAIFGGFGSFLVFVPQIFILTFIIGILEDCGYLGRAAVICHKPLSLFGLSGKSFVPYLSGFACAIPAMMAARTIESPKKRLITILTVPLMACSARLPVYSLFITAFIPATTFAGGLFGYQGLAFFGLYLFGLVIALIISALLDRVKQTKVEDTPFILELPPYRLPHAKPLLLKSFQSAKSFVKRAGAVIFMVTFIVWVLGYFPNGTGALETSWLATLGQWIEPVFRPLGVDWRYGVAILASFLAREVFVGTLGTLKGIESADDDIQGLADKLQADGLGLASGIGLLVFYAIALQCVSTLAVMKQEIGSNKLVSILIFIAYTALAYSLAIVVRQILL